MADAWGSFTNPSVTQPSATGGGSPGGGSPGGSTPSWGGAGGNTPAPGGAPGGGQPGGANPGTFGQAAYPWDMPYQGQFTAPMSPYENNALQGYNQFVQGGQGLNNAGNYLNNELSGQYLNMNSNPYLQQIQQGEQGMKNYNDQQAMNRIGSSMAVGGNALSGARLGAQNDYMNQSNNQFEALMGNLMNQNYQGERGLMNQAPGQLANLANTAGSGYAQLFGMGALPRSLQQNDLNAQYNDFQRQTGNMQNSYNQPQNQILQMLYGGGYKGQYQPTYGSSTLDQIAGLLGGSNIDYSSILNSLGGLFGGGGTPESAATGTDGIRMGYDGDNISAAEFLGGPIYSDIPDQVGDRLMQRQPQIQSKADPMMMSLLMELLRRKNLQAAPGRLPQGRNLSDVMGYDAAPGTSGPANYYDKNWYNNALTAAEANRAQQTAAAKNGPNTTVPAILTLLMSLLGQSGSNKSKGGIGLSPGATSPGSRPSSSPTPTNPGSANPNSSVQGPPNDFGSPSSFGGMNDPNNPFASDPYTDPFSAAYNNPLFDPNNFAGGTNDPYQDYSNQTGLFDPNNFAGGGGDAGGGGGGDFSAD